MNNNKKQERIGKIKKNSQGCHMKIIDYRNSNDIDIEFLDDFHYIVHGTRYRTFNAGNIKNPYYPSVFGVGTIGVKYPLTQNNEPTKEYLTWKHMLQRCFDEKFKERQPTYKDVTCCANWLYFENFYEWLHSQENFDKWLNGERWAIDKDILVKGNKIYSSETCCLVPPNVNSLFLKGNANRGDLPIGVCYCEHNGCSYYVTSVSRKRDGSPYKYFKSPSDAYIFYKKYKEEVIQQSAIEEYEKGNITKACYEAMMNYEVKIDD